MKAIEKFANFPTVDHNELVFYSCVNFVDVKILEILCHQPDFDINFKHPLFRIGFIQVSMIKGNVFALNYLKNSQISNLMIYMMKLFTAFDLIIYWH